MFIFSSSPYSSTTGSAGSEAYIYNGITEEFILYIDQEYYGNAVMGKTININLNLKINDNI